MTANDIIKFINKNVKDLNETDIYFCTSTLDYITNIDDIVIDKDNDIRLIRNH